jgi:hypothetical protein
MFLRAQHQPAQRAQHALHMLAQYAHSSEGYLFLSHADALEFAASLDERTPPDGLEALLSRLPANDTRVASTVDLPDGERAQRYSVFPLRAENARVGLAVLRDSEGEIPQLPSALLNEIGRVLHEEVAKS